MKKIFILSLWLTLSICNQGFANDICSVIGHHQPGSYEYNGPTICDLVNFPTIIVHGPLTITSSSISGEARISGPIHSSNSVFSSIIIENNHSRNRIYLNDHSSVKNDITFASEIPGKVYVDSTSSIEGHVNNGSIIKR